MAKTTNRKVPYSPIITHDVDRYYKWKNVKSLVGESFRILGGKSSWTIGEAVRSFGNRNQTDPFSNLVEIAALDLQAGIPSVFYIMTTEEAHPLNINDYDVEDSHIQSCLKQLVNMGCEIGIHPGINTSADRQKMLLQKQKLEKVIDKSVTRSRQHYLKYEYPTTFKYLEEIGIKNDSSIRVNLSKEDAEKCSTYKMFDDGNIDGITQTPLVFMETHHMSKSDDEILITLEASLAPAKKNGGEIMILWHNNAVSNRREVGLYKEALEVIKSA